MENIMFNKYLASGKTAMAENLTFLSNAIDIAFTSSIAGNKSINSDWH